MVTRPWTYQLGLALAAEWDMTTEFRESFESYTRAGDSEHEATLCALYEWDILPADDVHERLVALGDKP